MTLNLESLFDMQSTFDRYLIKEGDLKCENLFSQKVLALQVELGQLADKWGKFRFWKADQVFDRNDMLLEYADCLYFILTIGLDLMDKENISVSRFTMEDILPKKAKSIFSQFEYLFYGTSLLTGIETFKKILSNFMGLGEMLGFTWDEIETAYIERAMEITM